MKSYNVLGLNAGNGVCLYPFKKGVHFNIMGNIESRRIFYDKNMEQWNVNFKGIPLWGSLEREVKHIGVDVIIGHPDCGDSSILRMSRAKEAGDVKENKSINLFLAGIGYYKPKFWLLENLPGFLKTHSIDDLKKVFPDYHILHWIESVSEWGNSQVSRKRLVIVGVSKKLPKKVLKYFKLKPPLTISMAEYFELGFDKDESICHVRESFSKTCNLYYKDKRRITYLEAMNLWNTEFEGKSKWPVGGKMKNQPGVSRHLKGKPPFTVRKQNRQFGTKGLVLSPREMANIQGVPQSFRLVYHSNNPLYWINKARLTVTKTMPYEIAEWFMKRVKKAKQYCEIARSVDH